MSQASSTGPITSGDRIAQLDGLRGLALLGVSIANLATFAGWFGLSPEARAALPTAAVDSILWFLTHVFVGGKFYTLFSLLFGIGFAVQMSRAGVRAEAAGVFERRFRRRLTVLLGIGLVHLCLIWFGDILTLYAICGFALLPFRHRSDRTLLTWAAVLLVLPVVQYDAMWAASEFVSPDAVLWVNPGVLLFDLGDAAQAALGLDGLGAFKTGGVREVLLTNLTGDLYRYGDLFWSGRFFKVFAIFLLGLWCGRRLTSGTLLTDTRLLTRVSVWGTVVGLPANVALAVFLGGTGDFPLGPAGLGQSVAYALGVVPLALAYAAAFVLLWRRAPWRRVLGAASPVGRMALTNYLAQSLMGIGLFYGIGLGVYEEVGPLVWTGIGLVLFAGQIAASAWWLRRFRYGPVEWLWRRLTYAEALPMRAPAAVPVP